MGRRNRRDEVTQAVRDYLAEAVLRSPHDYPLDIGSVATALGCVRSSIYNYGLEGEIAVAAKKQKELSEQNSSGKPNLKLILKRLRAEIELTEQRNRALLERLNLVEANAQRLGIDPEELYKPLLKPPRMVSNAGRSRSFHK